MHTVEELKEMLETEKKELEETKEKEKLETEILEIRKEKKGKSFFERAIGNIKDKLTK